MFGAAAAVAEGVGGNLVTRVIDRVLGGKIKITDPSPNTSLRDLQSTGGRETYRVRGELKRLPKGHKIWLLVEHQSSPNEFWVQGISDVEYDPNNRSWEGRVSPSKGRCTIHAVVAPPTSVDLFRFYKRANQRCDKGWEPLIRIPPECTNRDEAHTSTP